MLGIVANGKRWQDLEPIEPTAAQGVGDGRSGAHADGDARDSHRCGFRARQRHPRAFSCLRQAGPESSSLQQRLVRPQSEG